ncbi:MAG: MarR family winged helix-turn-helix transcriptional regulator, partial [Pseudomonadota bacterium]
KHVKNLVASGFVETAPDQKDGRVTRVYLTQKGLDVRDAVASNIRELERTLVEPLDADDRARFANMLRVLVQENRKRLEVGQETRD